MVTNTLSRRITFSRRGGRNFSRAAFAVAALAIGCAILPTQAAPTNSTMSDPYLWLEEITGDRALEWVKAQNTPTQRELEADPRFEPLRRRLLSIFDSRERIPQVAKHGLYYYNFWRDEVHVRGIWRRTSLAEYRKPAPRWEPVLDLDALAGREKENWVWKGYTVLFPSYDRCLIHLSRGGADAVVVREFDLRSLTFAAEGFALPEAKSRVAWRDRDTLYVGTDFGTNSMTTSGYPRLVKEWKRGTPLSAARLVAAGEPQDVGISAEVAHDHGRTYELLHRELTFYTSETRLRRGDAWVKLEKPEDATVDFFQGQLLLRLRSDWTVDGHSVPAGSLIACNLEKFLSGKRNFERLFTPSERTSLAATTETLDYLILNELDNVKSRLEALQYADGRWRRFPLPAPGIGTLHIQGIDPHESNDYFLTESGFLTPSTLQLGRVGSESREKLKQLPAFFDSRGLEVQQHEAVSKDGTKIPYFQVGRKGLMPSGTNATLLYGYGGFEIPMLPGYSPAMGAAWLESGGVYVLANIRGGGEFGPRWHEAARKQNRQRAYDDFIAVAEDLIRRGVTSPAHLGIQGGSNGGLLMGVMLTQRPDLFKAVVCQVPLLDMRRYHQLLAGASWMAEYGDPDDPAQWAYIRKYSPYQNARAGMKYPRTLFLTSTRDDRVHPGHARKMVARLREQGHDVLYYENLEGGHGGAANNAQTAYMSALAQTFLQRELR